jgi:hypothetical protein
MFVQTYVCAIMVISMCKHVSMFWHLHEYDDGHQVFIWHLPWQFLEQGLDVVAYFNQLTSHNL